MSYCRFSPQRSADGTPSRIRSMVASVGVCNCKEARAEEILLLCFLTGNHGRSVRCDGIRGQRKEWGLGLVKKALGRFWSSGNHAQPSISDGWMALSALAGAAHQGNPSAQGAILSCNGPWAKSQLYTKQAE
jgi:hypothetical protein